MKFEKTTRINGAFIPRSALALSGFAKNEEATLHTLPGVVLLLKKHMTAQELLQTVDSLSQIGTELLMSLCLACGACENCGCGECPAADDVPETLLPLVDSLGLCLGELESQIASGEVIYYG
jgi:hypothetical protein